MARDLGCSVVLLVVAACYYYAASGIGRSALSDEVGAAGLPIAYALVLATIGALLGLQALARRFLNRARAAVPEKQPPMGVLLRRASGVLAIGIAYLLIVNVVGYLIALVLTLGAMLVYMGEHPSARVALAAVGGAGLFWVLFDRVLGIPMPGVWGL